MKTSLKVTVTTALAMALVYPLNMALAQGFSFNAAALKSTRSTASKTRNAKAPTRPAPSKSRVPGKTFSKPIAKPAPSRRPNSKVTGPTFQPIRFKLPEKNPRITLPTPNRSVPKPLAGGKKPPFNLTPPIKRPIKLPGFEQRPDPRTPNVDPRLIEELNRIGRSRRPLVDPERLREIGDALGNRHGNANSEGNPPAAEERAPDVEQDLQPGEENLVPPQENGRQNAHCNHGCHGHCNHRGPSFGLDFPRWGFGYGPGGIYIRGGGRRYVERPGTVVVVEDSGVVEENSAVEIREVNDLPEVYVATTIALSSKLPLGNEMGQVILDIQGISLPTELRAWTNESATCTLPMMGLDQPKEARLIMITAQGEVAHSISVLLMPAKAPAENPLD
ncbi:MAG: hypothetical protein GY917_01100 [Planctomycetaceae bacterium]|nr:hypothetical protein [Planctomycetaceae bacterium]MCP4813917.1 hypothetical protein [Planctomycetaceae bacterium]